MRPKRTSHRCPHCNRELCVSLATATNDKEGFGEMMICLHCSGKILRLGPYYGPLTAEMEENLTPEAQEALKSALRIARKFQTEHLGQQTLAE